MAGGDETRRLREELQWPFGPYTGRKRVRKSFGRIPTVGRQRCRTSSRFRRIPTVRVSFSVDGKLWRDRLGKRRGLQEVFRSVFPIQDLSGPGNAGVRRLRVRRSRLRRRGVPAAGHDLRRAVESDTAAGCVGRGRRDRRAVGPLGYQGAGRVYGRDAVDDRQRHVRGINGTERVIVSQMHRSPGVFFDHATGKTGHSSVQIPICGAGDSVPWLLA